MLSVVKKTIQLLALSLATLLPASEPHAGLNLPSTQGTSNAGNFQPGIFPFDYTPEVRERIANSHFTHLRLSLNAETAHNPKALDQLESLAALTDYHGILCMWDTNQGNETGHGNGLPNDLDQLAAAWKAIHQKFSKYPNLRYEIFNEPFGYPYTPEGAKRYLADMRTITEKANLPVERCILNALGYAQEPRLLVQAGWTGSIAYHVYPNWLPEEKRSAKNFTKHIVSTLVDIPNEILVTEYGTSLNQDPSETGETSLIPGLANAIQHLNSKGSQITGTYHWHGWDNGDSYSYWHPDNADGADSIHTLPLQKNTSKSN